MVCCDEFHKELIKMDFLNCFECNEELIGYKQKKFVCCNAMDIVNDINHVCRSCGTVSGYEHLRDSTLSMKVNRVVSYHRSYYLKRIEPVSYSNEDIGVVPINRVDTIVRLLRR